jgi:secreted trypsin-like serine protease
MIFLLFLSHLINAENIEVEKNSRIVNGADSTGYPWLAAIVTFSGLIYFILIFHFKLIQMG